MKSLSDVTFEDLRLVVFDFDGVFTDNTVIVSEDGREYVTCSRFDGLGLRLLDAVNVDYIIMSTETNPVVSARAKKLGIKCIQSVDDKGLYLKKLAEEYCVSLNNVAFLGNDVNDIPAFKLVGYPIAVADAWPSVNEYCIAKTKLPGGRGAVRELCEKIYTEKY